MVTKTIVHFEIPAQDVEKLSKFYSDVFGWKFEKTPIGEMEYWMITTGPRAKSVYGGMYKKQIDMEMPRNYIAVDKIDKAIETFTMAGGKQIVQKMEVPGIGWSFIGVDPEGNAVGLFEGARARPKPKKKTAKMR
ncbi:MAG: VOC family protein [Thaumarchaeota archaeon]|nr:VOC family protein [Nitrososphaerota archaeon]